MKQKNLSEIKIQSSRIVNAIAMNDTMSDFSAIIERLSEYDAKQKSINTEIKKTIEIFFR